MKKFLVTLLVLALLAGIAYGVYFYIMMPPIKNLEQAKENLENADYSVMHHKYEGEEAELVDYLEVLMASKKDDDGNSQGLYIIVFESNELARIQYEQLKNMMDSQKKDIELSIDSYEYKLKNDDLSETEREILEERIEEYKEELEEITDIYIARWGKTVWYGHKEVIRASRG